jgi:WD40-like Beta Propeller Repeat
MSKLKRAQDLALVGGTIRGAALAGPHFSAWSTAQKVDEIAGNRADVNTASPDGCPIQSPDGLSLFMASNRPGSMESSPGVPSLDIPVAYRESSDAPFGEPVNLGSPVNSAADDFCPTPVRGNGLFFVSRKVVGGVTWGLGDIYFTRLNPDHGWSTPEHLGCAPAGLNTTLDEQGPSYFEADGSGQLYFSSSRVAAQGGLVRGDIFVSTQSTDGTVGPGSLVSELGGTPQRLPLPTTSSRTCARMAARWCSRRTGRERSAARTSTSRRATALQIPGRHPSIPTARSTMRRPRRAPRSPGMRRRSTR